MDYYGFDDLGFNSEQGQEIFLCSRMLRLAIGCETGHTPLSCVKVRIDGTILLLPPYTFMARTVINLITYYEQLFTYCSAVRLFSERILCYLLYFVCCAEWRGHLVSKNRHHKCSRTVLRNIFGFKGVRVTGRWRKLYNEKLHENEVDLNLPGQKGLED